MNNEEKKYPYEEICWCKDPVWVFKNRQGKEYAKDSGKSIMDFKNSGEDPDFHKHRNWREKVSQTAKKQQKISDISDTEPEGEITQIDALLFIGKQIQTLNRLLADVLPVALNMKLDESISIIP